MKKNNEKKVISCRINAVMVGNGLSFKFNFQATESIIVYPLGKFFYNYYTHKGFAVPVWVAPLPLKRTKLRNEDLYITFKSLLVLKIVITGND